MPLCTSYGVGQYVASEAHAMAYGRLYKNNSTIRPIIYFTGGPGVATDFLTATASGSHIAPRLVDLGVPFISAAFGGAAQWGNDTCQTRIGQAWTYVKAQLGTKTDKFIAIGVSKGGTAVLNYARNNPSNVAAVIGIVPAVNLTDIHDNDRSGLASQIEAAYGGLSGWNSAKATHDPALNTSTHASQGIPIKLIYGDSDTTCTPQTITAFGSAVGATLQSTGPQDHLDVAPLIDPVEDIWKFIAGYIT